jgi:hypothetical protein
MHLDKVGGGVRSLSLNPASASCLVSFCRAGCGCGQPGRIPIIPLPPFPSRELGNRLPPDGCELSELSRKQGSNDFQKDADTERLTVAS